MYIYNIQAVSEDNGCGLFAYRIYEEFHVNLREGLILFTQPLRSGRIWHKVNFLSGVLTGLNSEFSFSWTSCLTKAEEPSLPYYLSIVGGRIIGFIPFPRVLVLCEMQWVLSRNWTRIAVFISCDDNHYTTGTYRRAWCMAISIYSLIKFI